MAPKAGFLTRRVTELTRVYKKNEQFKSILTFIESKTRKHMQKKIHGT